MRYDELRDALKDALGEAGYVLWPVRVDETLDLDAASRKWTAFLDRGHPATAEPFYVCQEVSFVWDAVDYARTHTSEGDLLRELFGGDDDLPATLPRHVRIDMILHASLVWGSRTLLPSRSRWRSWARAVDERMAIILPTKIPMQDGRPVVVMAWRGMVELTARCADDGEPCLSEVSLPTWQAVVPPTIQDGATDDGNITAQLVSLVRSYRRALDEWFKCVADLKALIR